MAGYSLREIKDAFAQKRQFDRQFPLSYFVVRPLSFYSAWLLLRITRSPSRIAGAGLIVGLAGCLAFWKIPEWSAWPGILLLLVYDLLDASDGNVARVTGNVTYYGKFLDGMVGELVEGSYPVWLGLGMYRLNDMATLGNSWHDTANLPLLLAGVVMSLGKLYSVTIMEAYYGHLEEKQAGARAVSPGFLTDEIQTSKYSGSIIYRLHLNVSSFDIQLLILTLCALAGKLGFFLIGYAAYFLLQAAVYFAFYLHRARRTLA